MRPFRFRAQVALDFRQREHDNAQRAFARADVELRAARGLLRDADDAVREAQERSASAMQARGTPGQLDWYRSWILRLRHERAARQVVVSAGEAEVARLAAECTRARQRVEALERFREKVRRAWEHAARSEEQKQIDAVATQRFVSARRAC